jgi:RHS repeat-associated protein
MFCQLSRVDPIPGASDERLETITNTGSSGNTVSQFTYGYTPAGEITSWAQATGTNAAVTYQYGYDGASELLNAITSTGSTALDTYAYRYDAAGNRLGQQIGVTGTNSVTSSAYNDLNQVTSVSGSAGLQLAISGSLSEPGTVAMESTVVSTDSNNDFNIVAPVVAGSNSIPITATSSGTAAAETTGTLQFNVTGGTAIPSLTYDANGNLTNDGTRTYTWDMANRLVKIGYIALGGSASSTITYDGLGRRIRIVETGSNGIATGTNNLIWDGMAIREDRNSANTVTKLYFDNGAQISGTDYYYTRDHLGSIREITGTNGVVLDRYAYDPYGQQTQLTGTMVSDFGYTGQYYHQPSGLSLAPYREYSVSLGRWISRDPLGERGGINLYGYVGNDPMGRIDPLGLWQVTISGGVLGFGGIITFGHNSGQWNGGAYAGLGAGFDFDYNHGDSGCHKQGNQWGEKATGGVGLGDHISGDADISGDDSEANITGDVGGVRGGYGTGGWTSPSLGFGVGGGVGIGIGATHYFSPCP